MPERVTCCGQPAWNSGHAAAAVQVAHTSLDALRSTPADVIVVPAGSCATMVRVFWQELFLLEGSRWEVAHVDEVAGRTFEVSEYLADQGSPLFRGSWSS